MIVPLKFSIISLRNTDPLHMFLSCSGEIILNYGILQDNFCIHALSVLRVLMMSGEEPCPYILIV